MRLRPEPAIFRWANPLIIALALFGAGVTSYLTVTHFFLGNAVAMCTAAGEGCDLVLNSEYAKVFGIPLTIFGALGYLTVAALAATPLVIRSEDLAARTRLKQQTAFLLFLVTTAMLVFSGYLMYLLAFVIKTACLYCITSAVTVTSLWLLNLFGNDWEDRGNLIFTGLIVSAIVLVGTLGVFSAQNKMAVVNQSFSGRLAQHLTVSGAKMYGAIWCPHCQDQKAKFGEAAKQIPYVECAENVEKSQTELCRSKNIKGFPTWEISGKMYEGERSLDELANLSGFKVN
jgi:uncharacterized membrane protein